MNRRIIVGISGASGVPISIALLKALKETDYEIHLVITRGGEKTILHEVKLSLEQVYKLADVVHDCDNIGASIASGTYETEGMIIVPCSMKTVAGIHSGYSDNLLLRAADVTLKERRTLILVTRECPLNSIHLRNIYKLSKMGALILPPMLSFYNNPETIEDVTYQIVGKILDQIGISNNRLKRWNG